MYRGLPAPLLAPLLFACAVAPPSDCERPLPAGLAGDASAVIEAVEGVFAAMRDHEVEALRGSVLPEAVIVALREGEGEGEDEASSIGAEAFIAGTAGDPAMTLDERFTQTPLVRVEGSVASLWGPYELFVDGERHHCGVDMVQLVRSKGAWRVTAITYSAHPCS